MKQLARQFDGRGEARGYTFVQLMASEHGYVYELLPRGGGKPHYEIFKHKENTYFNCVSYPTAKAFGVWAWTTSNASRALQIFKKLNDGGDSRQAEELQGQLYMV